MTDDVPDTCARCGDTIRGRPSQWSLPPEWRMYLDDERDLRWFPIAPVVICCFDCRNHLDHLHDSISEHRGYGSEEDAERLEAEMHEELAGLNLDCIVDEGEL